MSELDKVVEPDHTAVRVESTGAGFVLRSAREAQGLHIAMLAVSLKVPVKKLEALESDRYDLLPDMVFVRALAASVCRMLKLDAAPVLAALPQSEQPHIKTNEAGLNTVFDDASGGTLRGLTAPLRKPLGITVITVIMGILLITFVPDEWLGSTFFASGIEDKTQANGQTSVELEGGRVPDQPRTAGLAQALHEPVHAASMTAADAADATAQQGSGAVVLPAAVPSAPVALTTGDVSDNKLLTLRALGSAWVEVVDAEGTSQLRKTLVKDEVVTLTGALPLSVVLGRADLVSVSVRGAPFDAAALAKDHVARFEVK